jgi:hypothetical protein
VFFLLCESILCINLLFANFSPVAISSLGARSANAAAPISSNMSNAASSCWRPQLSGFCGDAPYRRWAARIQALVRYWERE